MSQIDHPASVTALRAVTDAYVDRLLVLNPALGSTLGLAPGMDRLPDFSPQGLAERADLARDTLARAEAAADEATRDVELRRELELVRFHLDAEVALHEAGDDLLTIGAVHSPIFQLRAMFPVWVAQGSASERPGDGQPGDQRLVLARLVQVPASLGSYRAALAEGLRRQLVPGERQIRAAVSAWRAMAGQDDAASLFARALPAGSAADRLAGPLLGAARQALLELATWVESDYLPHAGSGLAGPERYARALHRRTGTSIDPVELHDWAWQRWNDAVAEQRREASRVLPGAGIEEALDHLERHGPAIDGTGAVVAYLQDLLDGRVALVDRDIAPMPGALRHIEAALDGPGGGIVAHYERPSLDLARPARTVLPVLGRTRFPTWSLTSLWHHEGVPGHHVQFGTWASKAGRLGRYRSVVAYAEAVTEGWAMYAEELMDEHGHLPTAGERMGYLDGQVLRAARAFLDPGLHLGLRVPDGEHAGERWTPELAEAYVGRHRIVSPGIAAGEVTRYLAWPGQATCYAIGQRAWSEARATAARRPGFVERDWHGHVVAQGSVTLDTLAELAGVPAAQ